jgi:hypothetical protein
MKPSETPEFARFTRAMRDIMKVSKGELQTRIEAQKESGSNYLRALPSALPLHPKSVLL